MALKIRLQRHGSSHRPFYRMVVTEASARRDGRFVELLGTYEPQAKHARDELNLKLGRIDYWQSVGAKPTDTAASLIRKVRREAPEADKAAEVEDKAAKVEDEAAEVEDKAAKVEDEVAVVEDEAAEVEGKAAAKTEDA